MIAVLALTVASVVGLSQPSYSGAELEARVVDSITGVPLEGVNVVATWEFEYLQPGIGEHRGRGFLLVQEAVTDAQGTFRFPPWGPKAIPDGLPGHAYLPPSAPALTFFKPEYGFKTIHNAENYKYLDDPSYVGESLRRSYWNGKTIQLVRFGGSLQQYGKRFDLLPSVGAVTACPWTETPRYRAALIKEGERLRKLGLRTGLPAIEDLQKKFDDGGCGSASEYISEYLR